MTYLIDTNICIYLMNQQPPEVIQRFKSVGVGAIGVSIITVSELQYGVAKSKHVQQNAKRLRGFLVPFDILPYDEVAAKFYGPIRSKLEKQGQMIGSLDLLIAAHALSLGSILVTNNEREFNRVPKLKVENWVA